MLLKVFEGGLSLRVLQQSGAGRICLGFFCLDLGFGFLCQGNGSLFEVCGDFTLAGELLGDVRFFLVIGLLGGFHSSYMEQVLLDEVLVIRQLETKK